MDLSKFQLCGLPGLVVVIVRLCFVAHLGLTLRKARNLDANENHLLIYVDQLISLYQRVTEIVDTLVFESQAEIERHKVGLAEQELATRSYFRDVLTQLGNIGDNVSKAVSDITSIATVRAESLSFLFLLMMLPACQERTTRYD
jgi:hypothetical protein